VKQKLRRLSLLAGVVAVSAGGLVFVEAFLSTTTPQVSASDGEPVPVEIAPVRKRAIERKRTLTGTLEAAAEFIVAPKVGGQVQLIAVDLSDEVEQGQIVAKLDDDEFVQAAAQARAALAVAKAEHAAAKSALTISERTLTRTRALLAERVASEANLDSAEAESWAAKAAVDVAAAQVARAQATLRAAEVRARFTRVSADWPGQDETRCVGSRYVDEGEMVAANTPLLSIVDLDPINVVVHVAEEDYGELKVDQPVTLSTDAYPGETFPAHIARVSPIFEADSRQARVELSAANTERRLKPGMFVRAEVLLERVAEATVVPRDALVTRKGRPAVFVVSEDKKRVSLRQVSLGIRQEGFVQVKGNGILGHVVTLGQQQLEDAAPIVVPPRGQRPRSEQHEAMKGASTGRAEVGP